MTSSRTRERARTLQRQVGITYQQARRLLRERSSAAAADGHATVADNPAGSSAGLEPPDPHTLDGMLYSAAEAWASRQFGEPVDDDVWSDFNGAGDLRLHEPTVGELALRPWTTYSQAYDEYEGGTLATTVFVQAELHVEGHMFKSEALASADSGAASVLEFDFNEHYAQVALGQTLVVEIEFNAIVTPDAESVDDFRLSAIRLLEQV